MFIRQRRSGQRIYAEALVSFRDPDTGKSRHRCVARWPAAHSLAEEIDEMQRDHDKAQRNVTFWQGLIDRTVEPLYPAQIRRARQPAVLAPQCRDHGDESRAAWRGTRGAGARDGREAGQGRFRPTVAGIGRQRRIAGLGRAGG